MSYIARHEQRPEEDSKHKSVVLEVDVIHNQETRMQEQRRRDDALHGGILRPSRKPTLVSSRQLEYHEKHLLQCSGTEHKFGDDDRCSLVCDHRPCAIVQVIEVDYPGVDQICGN